jgi:LuxR family maltose regulon positive regulatory protein
MSAISEQTESQIPRVSGVIQRPRLLAHLKAASEHKLTLVCAPPGYGKTTVVAQFAWQSRVPVAWHTVEERERDVPNLYHQCLATLGQVVPGIHSLVPVPGYTPGELAGLIADYLREHLTRKMIYILDDAHLLTGSPAAELWLHTLVSLLPATCHLVLVSRVLPSLPLTEMIARGEVVAIGQEQLRFTAEEVYHLTHEALGEIPPKIDLDELTGRLEGWPAGIALAIHPLPADLERAMLNGGQGPEALFNALANSMLPTQPLALIDFLLASSTLSRITPELCSTVLQLPDSSYWLAEVQNRNLFLSRVSGGLVYHRLFRDFLQQRLKAENSSRFVALHARAAQWFEENNRLDDSFDHYMSAGLIERATAIAEHVAQAYFAQGKVETLLRWRSQVGQAGVFAPSLLYNCARVYTDRYHYDLAEAALDEAERGYQADRNKLGVTNVQIQRGMIKLQQGDYQTAAAQSSQLAAAHPKAPNLRGRSLKILGVALLRLGEVDKAIANLEEAVQLHRVDGDAYALANVLQDMGVAYSRSGRLDDASACLQEVVALRRSLGSAGALALALNNLGYYYHRSGNYRQAMSTFQEGLSVVARTPNRRAESYLLWSIGDLQRDRGAFEEALRFYNKALELLGSSEPSLRCAILISAASLQRWQGKFQAAATLAKDALALAHAHRIALESATAEANLWVAKAHLGESSSALEHLELVLADLRKQGSRFELVWAYALAAHVALMTSNSHSAEHYLQAGIRLAQEVGSAQPMVAELLHTPLLEVHIINNSSKYSILMQELGCLRETQVKTSVALKLQREEPQVTYTLRVWTLGQEQIERDGELIAASEWRANSAREMFMYLLFQGPQSREQISLEFWPDSHPKRVRSNFHTTLYRARQALGDNVITFQDGLYLINPDLDLWCDAHELETLTQHARLLPPRDALTEDLWDRAIKLYRGDFLPSWDTAWVTYRRESLMEAFLEALIGLGECARARNNVKDALLAFKRALDVDPYREDVHRAIMSCYARMGEKKQILAHLQKLQQLLWEELGIEPSDETLELASSLLS